MRKSYRVYYSASRGSVTMTTARTGTSCTTGRQRSKLDRPAGRDNAHRPGAMTTALSGHASPAHGYNTTATKTCPCRPTPKESPSISRSPDPNSSTHLFDGPRSRRIPPSPGLPTWNIGEPKPNLPNCTECEYRGNGGTSNEK